MIRRWFSITKRVQSEMEIVKPVHFELIITITRTKAAWFGLGETFETKERYRGSGTVWYTYPDAIRCHTGIERWLTNIWTRYRWEAKQN
jgi:hypothetical protein